MAAFVPTLNPRPAVGTGHGPDEAALVASGAYTATASQEFAVIADCEAIEVFISVTARANVASTTPSIEAFDAVSGTWITLLTGAALTTAATVLLLVGWNVVAATNVAAQHIIRQRMRVTMTHSTGDAHTYSISVAAT